MEKNAISSIQDAVPSTSTAANKKKQINTLPHIIALPSNSQANSNMRLLQLAPIKCLPKGNINLIKLDASTSLLNMKVLRTTTNQEAIQNLKPVQLKIPIQKSTPNHISPTKSAPVINTQNTSNVPSVPKIVGPKPPTKKYQPNIIQRKSVTPTKSSEVTNTQSTEKGTEGNTIKHDDHSTVMVKDIVRKVRNRTSIKKKLQNKDAKHVKRKRGKLPLKQETEKKKETTVPEEMLYVADGFRADVETLMEKCSHVYKLNFEKFTDIWKEMRFSRIFHGRQSGAELAEFTEEAIYIAKSYMVATSVSFEENIAGLFLVYALLNLQPFPGYAPLRLVPSDVPSILALERGARKQRRHDVLYVLGNVLVRGPTHAHVCVRETGLELPLRKYYDGTVQIPEAIESVFTRNAGCVRQLRQLVQLEQRYHGLRQRLQADKIRNLCSQPAAALMRAYHEHIPSAPQTETETTTELLPGSPEKETSARIDLMKSIRDRAMANTVDSMRHLTGVGERLHELSSSDEEPTARGRGNSKEKKRFQAATIQKLFTTPEATVVDAPTPSRKEMPTLDGFGELGSEVHISSVNSSQDDSNNVSKSRSNTQILRNLLTRTKGENEKFKNKYRQLNKRRQVLNSDFDVDSIEAQDPKAKRNNVMKKSHNTKKGQEKGNSNNDLNANEFDTSHKEQTAENTNNDAENGIQNMSREEEISYLRSIIEEIEGSIEQDPTQPVTGRQTNVHNHKKIIEIEMVECEFGGTPKTTKRKMESDTVQSDEKKPKTEPKCINNKKDGVKSEDSKKKTLGVKIISNELWSSDSSTNKTPKARQSLKKSSPTNVATKSPKNVASAKTYASPKTRNTQLKLSKNVARSVTSPNTFVSPKIVGIKSLNSPKRDDRDISPKSADVKSIGPREEK